MDALGNLLIKVWPVLLSLAMLEILILKRQGKTYNWRETLCSLADAVMRRAVITFTGFNILLFVGSKLYPYRMFDLTVRSSEDQIIWWQVGLLFFGLEFFYYWFHRFSHEIRWFWATHAVHHSPNSMSLLTAERLGFTQNLSAGTLTFLPLVWLGFKPEHVLSALAFNLLYQFWLHTEVIKKLGWFEFLFNSPSHHRVHHASNARYLDANYGGVLIIFDRIFGTLIEEDENDPVVFGLVKPLKSYNPLKIALHEWVNLVQDIRRNWRFPSRILGYLFGPPGFSHDGSRQTSVEIKKLYGFSK